MCAAELGLLTQTESARDGPVVTVAPRTSLSWQGDETSRNLHECPMRSAISESDLVTVTDAAGRVNGERYVERAPFVIAGNTPDGDLAVPVGSARAAAQAARHLTGHCPHTQASWQINPQARPSPVVVVGCARPPAGEHLLDQHARVFLLAAGDPLAPVWIAWCGHEIGDTQLEVLDVGMGHPCPGCHQHWATAHHQDTGLPVRSPGQHLHPPLRRRPTAPGKIHHQIPDRPPAQRVPPVSSWRPVGHQPAPR